VAAAGPFGCGGGHESAGTTTAPQLTVPRAGSRPAGTASAPADSIAPSTAGHTVRPSPGTPEERFRHFCNANPGVCG
jgi:hypothetical protein